MDVYGGKSVFVTGAEVTAWYDTCIFVGSVRWVEETGANDIRPDLCHYHRVDHHRLVGRRHQRLYRGDYHALESKNRQTAAQYTGRQSY